MTDIAHLQDAIASKAKSNYDLITSIPTEKLAKSGDAILKNVLKKIGRFDERGDIFFAHSNLETASIKLCEMFSEFYPNQSANGTGLLEEIFEQAFGAFFFSVASREPHVNRVVRFLESLTSASDYAQHIHAFFLTPRGDTVLWPWFSIPLGEWARNNDAVEICFAKAPPPTTESEIGGRTYLSSHILTMNDIGRLAMYTRRREML